MKLSPKWLREFVDLKVDDRQLANDLTLAGVAVESVGEDGIFEMEITTNRPDCMNHYGVAREASAIYDLPLKAIEPRVPKAQAKAEFPIEITDLQGCARYTARIIRNLKVGPSSPNIVLRLASVDQRSINNVADASNYTLWEMGHPTHAFDLDLLQGGKIIVRRARSGESLKTLDGVERKLSPEDLVIADAKRPVALAGVMGGLDTMITDRTRNVLIESAWFDPVSIRKASRRHGLHTDASHRFERGADFGATSLACARVAQLILDSAGGTIDTEEIDVIARRITPSEIALRRTEAERILGEKIAEEKIARILRRLGFTVTPGRTHIVAPSRSLPLGTGGTRAAVAEEVADFAVHVPSWRLDVEREIDLIEEIARIHGYDRFPNTLPVFSGSVAELPGNKKDTRIRGSLLALGYNEAISLTFISPSDAKTFSQLTAVEIENPLSEEMSVLRNSLVPGMLEMLAWNLNRGVTDIRLFERGNVFGQAGPKVDELRHICLAATGHAAPPSVHQAPRPFFFFDMKGDIETILQAFDHDAMHYDSPAADYYHPGRSSRVVMDGATVAQFGQLHSDVIAQHKLRLPASNDAIFLGAIFLDRLYEHALRDPHYEPLPKYPAVERDFSFIFDESITYERIRGALDGLRLSEMRSFVPVEIFRGGMIPSGNYSLLLRVTFQSHERTLREDEVTLWSNQIAEAIKTLGGRLRA